MCAVVHPYNRVSHSLFQAFVRDVLLLGHKQAYSWMDEWHGLSLEDIRKYEDETKAILDKVWEMLVVSPLPSILPLALLPSFSSSCTFYFCCSYSSSSFLFAFLRLLPSSPSSLTHFFASSHASFLSRSCVLVSIMALPQRLAVAVVSKSKRQWKM